MLKTRYNKRLWVLPVLCILTTLLLGCATEYEKKDPFFTKWGTLAEEATGHSPAPKEAPPGLLQTFPDADLRAEEETSARRLPTNPVSLNLPQGNDVKAVLRALAKIAGQNISIKNEIKGEVTVSFSNVPWDQAFLSILRMQGLDFKWDGDIIRIVNADDIETDLRLATAKEKYASRRYVTKIIKIHYADPVKIRENFQEMLRDPMGRLTGWVRVDEHSSSVIIQATEADMNRLLPLLPSIDRPSLQVQIKCNIVETTKEMARNLGVQWGGVLRRPTFGNRGDLTITPGGNTGSASPPNPASTTNPNPPLTGGYTPTTGTPGISGQGMGVNFPVTQSAISAAGGGLTSVGFLVGNIGSNILELQLNALQNDNRLRILSSPSITTLDNQKAFTENGTRVPYSTLDTSVVPPTRTVKFEDVVLRLEITPHVIDGKNLKMTLIVKKDEVDPINNVEGNPYIIKKQTQTVLVVEDGETIVISGLTKQTIADTSVGVPGAKDIPGLGWLFKRQDKDRKMEEVLIFITPQILPVKTAQAAAGATATTVEQKKQQ